MGISSLATFTFKIKANTQKYWTGLLHVCFRLLRYSQEILERNQLEENEENTQFLKVSKIREKQDVLQGLFPLCQNKDTRGKSTLLTQPL